MGSDKSGEGVSTFVGDGMRGREEVTLYADDPRSPKTGFKICERINVFKGY